MDGIGMNTYSLAASGPNVAADAVPRQGSMLPVGPMAG